MPTPGPGEVVVAVAVAGLCGTDLMVYAGNYPGAIGPLTLGHEYSGEVVAAGPGVTHLKAGDRIVSEGSWSCGTCDDCRSGQRCVNRSLLGRTADGCFAEYVKVPARICSRLPPGVSHAAGQALLTVATVMRALSRGQPEGAERAAIIGTGHAGLLLLQALRAAMPGEIACLGTRTARLELAREFGADTVSNVRSSEHAGWLAEVDRRGGSADLVFEASGTLDGLDTALKMVRTGGRVVVYSIYDKPHPHFEVSKLYHKEVSLIGSRGGTGYLDAAVQAVESGHVQPERLITLRTALGSAPDTLAQALSKPPDLIRAIFSK